MIIFDIPGLWTPRDMAIVNHAVATVTWALEPYTDLPMEEVFAAVFGEQHVRFNNGIDFLEQSTGNTLIFQRGRVSLQLTIHALGHTFDRRANLLPQKQLAAGRFNLRHALLFAGMHPPSMDGGNEPNERWANTWENFVDQTFAPNIFGIALEKFIEAHMGEWVAIARAG